MQITLKTLFDFFPALRGIILANDDQIFDEYLEKHIETCVADMEANAQHLHSDAEEKLSSYFAAALRHPGLEVYREAYSNGRVDLTIRQAKLVSGFVRLAEAKIYSGPAYHDQALDQLINRYSTGRHRTGYVIEYFQNGQIDKLVGKLQSHANKSKPHKQVGTTTTHPMAWAYESNHTHSSGKLLRVVHVNVNLVRPVA